MLKIRAAQSKDIPSLPGLCLRAFAVVYAVTNGLRKQKIPDAAGHFLDRRPNRLPMGVMSTRIDSLLKAPLERLWREIIEKWIIAQHVHWSALRGADGKKRLRMGLEGSGWIRVRAPTNSGFPVTADRLFTLLSLSTECGIFTRSIDADGARFSAA
jgi:hypothetical protein